MPGMQTGFSSRLGPLVFPVLVCSLFGAWEKHGKSVQSKLTFCKVWAVF